MFSLTDRKNQPTMDLQISKETLGTVTISGHILQCIRSKNTAYILFNKGLRTLNPSIPVSTMLHRLEKMGIERIYLKPREINTLKKLLPELGMPMLNHFVSVVEESEIHRFLEKWPAEEPRETSSSSKRPLDTAEENDKIKKARIDNHGAGSKEGAILSNHENYYQYT